MQTVTMRNSICHLNVEEVALSVIRRQYICPLDVEEVCRGSCFYKLEYLSPECVGGGSNCSVPEIV